MTQARRDSKGEGGRVGVMEGGCEGGRAGGKTYRTVLRQRERRDNLGLAANTVLIS